MSNVSRRDWELVCKILVPSLAVLVAALALFR